MEEYVGHVALHSDELASAKHLCLVFAAGVASRDFAFVFEFGSDRGHPHLHFWVRTPKAHCTFIQKLKAVFNVSGAGSFSTKKADPTKLERYFLYLAKGVNGKREDKVEVVLESAPRLWDVLHDKFHDAKEAFKVPSKKVKLSEDWYLTLANECKASGSVTKEDVLQVVTRYFVYESKKGFDRFAVSRTFWRVFSLVNGADAHAMLLETCQSDLFRC